MAVSARHLECFDFLLRETHCEEHRRRGPGTGAYGGCEGGVIRQPKASGAAVFRQSSIFRELEVYFRVPHDSPLRRRTLSPPSNGGSVPPSSVTCPWCE